MTKAQLDKLDELAEDLKDSADAFFEVGEGSSTVSQQRSDEQMAFYGQIRHLVAYIEAIRLAEPEA